MKFLRNHIYILTFWILLGFCHNSAFSRPITWDLKPYPSEESRKNALKIIQDVFKKEYAGRTQAEKKLLCQKLLNQNRETKEDSATRFVIYQEVARLANETGDAITLRIDLDLLADEFVPEANINVISAIAPNVTIASVAQVLANYTIPQLEEALSLGKIEIAIRLYELVLSSAKKSNCKPALQILEPYEEIGSLEKEINEIKPLIGRSEDPDVNLIVGKFRCFRLGSWKRGLVNLAGCNDAKLKMLAEKELMDPKDAQNQLFLADGWWDLAETEKGLSKRNLLNHAAGWYRNALKSDLSGLNKVRVEKRLQEARSSTTKIIDFLKLINPARDSVQGKWILEDGKLVTPEGDVNRLQLSPPNSSNYRLTLHVERIKGEDALAVGIIIGRYPTVVIFDCHPNDGYCSGFDRFDNQNVKDNATTHKGKVLQNGIKHEIVFTIRSEVITIRIDDRPFYKYLGNSSRFSREVLWAVPNPKALFIGSISAFRISKLELEQLSDLDR